MAQEIGTEAGSEGGATGNGGEGVRDYRYPNAKRKNIPPAGLAAQGKIAKEKSLHFAYNPHLPPRLLFDQTGRADRLKELLDLLGTRALSEGEISELKALAKSDPYLEWSGKCEEPACVVDPVALHIHERVSAQAILKMAAREDVPRNLFADPAQELSDALRFYQSDVEWSNRLILGDSLAVMASLARREGMTGKVQCVYMDPPYGIKYGSNFQSEVGKRDVKDGKAEDLTREPEMIKAYRDTWHLGVHSYLTYLRQRLYLVKELLSDTGSIFLQISDENLHRVRAVMDEVFGPENFVSAVAFATTGGFTTQTLSRAGDYLIWYAKDSANVKYRQLYYIKGSDTLKSGDYRYVELSDGQRRIFDEEKEVVGNGARIFRFDNITSQDSPSSPQPLEVSGQIFEPRSGRHWTAQYPEGMRRLMGTNRIHQRDGSLASIRYIEDYPVFEMSNIWDDTSFAGTTEGKRYVVQTNTKVIERCILMTTDPGDLVLDPTCGSGTTAYVAEQWGRRWITCDTSRVALAIARQRLLTARFDYYRLRPTSAEDAARNPDGPWLQDPTGDLPGPVTFDCKTVPHVTLKSIAQNQALDNIFEKWEPVLRAKLEALNEILSRAGGLSPADSPPSSTEMQNPVGNVTSAGDKPPALRELAARLRAAVKAILTPAQQKRVGDDLRKLKSALSDADWRRYILPPDNRPEKLYTTVGNDFAGWYEWEVPFESAPEWPEALTNALTDYRTAWRQKRDAVNAAISARAEQEELVDQPYPVRNVTRVTGPFTVEGVIPAEDSIDLDADSSPVDQFDADVETFDGVGAPLAAPSPPADTETTNAEAYVEKMLTLLRADGVRFPNNKIVKFDRLDRADVDGMHGEGEWTIDGLMRRVAVVLGPQYGPLVDGIVQDGMFSAASVGCPDLVFAAFSFDAAAQASIQSNPNKRLTLHMAQIRPDVNMGDLLKTTTSSQLFTVSGTPRIALKDVSGGECVVEMQGVDIYDPVTNSVRSAGADKVAAWFVDGDYDGRTFCITQAFFPDKKAWDKLAKALSGKIDADVFAAFSGTVSLPFRPGKQIAVKVIDPRGNEVMWVRKR